MGTVIVVVFGVTFPLRWAALPVLALTLIGVSGFGFATAGITLIYKQTASFTNLVNNSLAFLNGSFLPVEAMPRWLGLIARTLPSTQGIVVLRRIVLEDRSLAFVWQDRSLVWLLVHSTLYATAGWAVFTACESAAKRQGSLGQY